MTDPGRATRRRADARRSRAAILDAALHLMNERPDTGLEAIASEAGVTRQTVYAHFASRDALVEALIDRATERILHALDTAELDALPPGDALARLVEISWDHFETHAFLLAVPDTPDTNRDHERHQPVLDRIGSIIERGQRSRELDPGLAPEWIAAATISLGHAAGEQVRAGTMTTAQAKAALTRTLSRGFTA